MIQNSIESTKSSGRGLSSPAIRKARAISVFWSKSSHFQESLAALQQANDPQISIYVKTRWYSNVTMMGSLIANRQNSTSIMGLVSAENRLNGSNWSLLDDVYHLMKPLVESISSLEADQTPTLILVLPAVFSVWQMLVKGDDLIPPP